VAVGEVTVVGGIAVPNVVVAGIIVVVVVCTVLVVV